MQTTYSHSKDNVFYEKNLAKFVRKYPGKFMVIVNQKIYGVYDSLEDALDHTLEHYEMGQFTLKEVGAEVHVPRIRMPVFYPANA